MPVIANTNLECNVKRLAACLTDIFSLKIRLKNVIMSHQTGKPRPAITIKPIVTRLIKISPRKPQRLSPPVRSIPALQNALTAVNIEYHKPFSGPYIGTNRIIYSNAPMPSIVSEKRTTRFVTPTIPCKESIFNESCIKST